MAENIELKTLRVIEIGGKSYSLGLSDAQVSKLDALKDQATLAGEIAALQGLIEAAQGDVDALETLVGSIPEGATSDTVVAYIKEVADAAKAAAISEATADHAQMRADINANTAALEVLNGDASTVGSVAKAAKDAAETAVAGVVDGADAAFDTLKEIANWINNSDAAAEGFNAASKIQTNADNIAALQTTVNGTEGQGGLVNKVAALEEAMGEGGSVTAQITAAINDLDAEKSSASVEEGKGLQVTVKQVDGKIDTVTLTGTFSSIYDEKGAAAAALQSAKDYADGLASNYDEAGAADSALNDAKAYADGIHAATETGTVNDYSISVEETTGKLIISLTGAKTFLTSAVIENSEKKA